jgi:hypothetical protein
MIRSPVAPVMSATTWWSCRFISVSALCMCWMCEAAYSSRRSRWRRWARSSTISPWGGSRHAATHENGAAAPLGVAYVCLAPGHMLGIACINEKHLKAALHPGPLR